MKLMVDAAGTSLDPALVKLFLRMLGVYPPRTVVTLSDGRVAIAIAPDDRDPHRPEVRVLSDTTGKFVTPVDILLADTPELSITGMIDPRRLNIDIDDYL